MRKTLATMLVVAPLMAACGADDGPLLPELKGRWEMRSLTKQQAERATPVWQTSQSGSALTCRDTYVTFSKRDIVMRMTGATLPLFQVSDAKREGERVILIGKPDFAKNASATQNKLVLRLLSNGEVRFEDIFDENNPRSVKHEQLPVGHPLRQFGATTRGDALRVIFDVKPCLA